MEGMVNAGKSCYQITLGRANGTLRDITLVEVRRYKLQGDGISVKTILNTSGHSLLDI